MTEPDVLRRAACACGALTADCAGEPARVSVCHCRACQQRTGSAFGVACFFPLEAVTLSGPSQAYTRGSDSGHALTFHFCPTCGATVWWTPERTPGRIAVALGAFADPDFPAPDKEVYEEHRHAWVAVAI